jgi:hypothetical protein
VYSPVKENFFVIYDQSTNYLSFVIDLISDQLKDHQTKIITYVSEHYENVTVFAHKTWLRMDFNNDGAVTTEDLKESFKGLYEFIKNYQYYEKAVEIKSQLYQEAIKYMKKDVQEGETKKESGLCEEDQKVEKLLQENQ